MTALRWLRRSGVALSVSLPLAGQSLHYEGGLSLASGAYIFTERTTSWSLMSGLALEAGPLTFRGALPLYLQNTALVAGTTTGITLPTGGPQRTAVRDSSAARGGQGHGPGTMGGGMTTDPVDVPSSAVTGYEPGIGDPTFGVTVSTRGRTALTVNAGVKAPVADPDKYGTGQWDAGGSVGISRILGQSVLLGANLGFWHLGDLPDLELQDPVMVSISGAYLSPRGWAASVSASGASAVIEGFDHSYSVAVGVSRVRSRATMGLLVAAGLSETAPDVLIGLNWRLTLAGR